MTYAKIIHSKLADQIEKFQPGYSLEGSCRVEFAAELDSEGPYTAVTITVGRSFHFESQYSSEKNIAALYRLFNYKTHTLGWRRTAPTGFELGTINENNTQFTMRLRLHQSFSFFSTILKSFFNIVPLYHAYKELRIESRKPTFTGQPFNWHEAVHGSKTFVRRPHEEAKVSAKAGALFTKTPEKKGSAEEKGEPRSCPPRIENDSESQGPVSELRRPGTA